MIINQTLLTRQDSLIVNIDLIKHKTQKQPSPTRCQAHWYKPQAWLCTKDNHFWNYQACIVTGPNIDIATKLIKRMKGIFDTKLGLLFDNKETVLELNGCTIEAYPSTD